MPASCAPSGEGQRRSTACCVAPRARSARDRSIVSATICYWPLATLGDYRFATVISWSDTAIVIEVPLDASSGCIGFRDRNIEAIRQQLYGAYVEQFRQSSAGMQCFGADGAALEPPPYGPSLPPCSGI